MNQATVTPVPNFVCKCCGATLRVVEIIMRRQPIRAPPWCATGSFFAKCPSRHPDCRCRRHSVAACGYIAGICCSEDGYSWPCSST